MWKFAVRNLLSRPLRSLLALLGLTVAIVGMVGLFSVARGLDRMVDDTFGRIPGLVAMQPGAPIPLFSTVPAKWIDDLRGAPGVHVVTPEIWQRVNVIEGRMIFSPPRFFCGTDIPSRLKLKRGVYQDEIVSGRFLRPEDRGTRHCVVSRQIAEEFGRRVGDSLKVNGHDVTIVGIYHCGSLLLDVAILMDIDVVRTITRFDERSVSCFYVEPDGTIENRELGERLSALFHGREIETWQPSALALGGAGELSNPLVELFRQLDRRLKELPQAPRDGDPALGPQTPPRAAVAPQSDPAPRTPPPPAKEIAAKDVGAKGIAAKETGRADDPFRVVPKRPLEVRSAADWAERFDRFGQDLELFLTIMTAIGVTVAVLSIVNTMLMSVTERIIEFGILKANGWTRGDVLKLVTCESAALGFAGGVCGSTLGWIAAQAVNAQWPTRVQLFASPGLLLFAVAFSTLLGVAGGLYPAWWAMRMLPMDAIRQG